MVCCGACWFSGSDVAFVCDARDRTREPAGSTANHMSARAPLGHALCTPRHRDRRRISGMGTAPAYGRLANEQGATLLVEPANVCASADTCTRRHVVPASGKTRRSNRMRPANLPGARASHPGCPLPALHTPGTRGGQYGACPPAGLRRDHLSSPIADISVRPQ